MAFYRHMVIQGTSPHSLAGKGKSGRFSAFPDGEVRANATLMHPGSKGNDFVSRTVDPQVEAIMDRFAKLVFGE